MLVNNNINKPGKLDHMITNATLPDKDSSNLLHWISRIEVNWLKKKSFWHYFYENNDQKSVLHYFYENNNQKNIADLMKVEQIL